LLKQYPARSETFFPSACAGVLRTRIAAGRLQPLARKRLRGRWLPAHEGRWLPAHEGRWSCTKKLVNTFVNKCKARQVVTQKGRQVFVGDVCDRQKTAVSSGYHCSLVLKRLVKHFESDGSKRRAGDGARTRDSLLGRQAVTKTPLG